MKTPETKLPTIFFKISRNRVGSTDCSEKLAYVAGLFNLSGCLRGLRKKIFYINKISRTGFFSLTVERLLVGPSVTAIINDRCMLASAYTPILPMNSIKFENYFNSITCMYVYGWL